MNPAALLALIGDLYAQLLDAQRQIAELTKDDDNTPDEASEAT